MRNPPRVTFGALERLWSTRSGTVHAPGLVSAARCEAPHDRLSVAEWKPRTRSAWGGEAYTVNPGSIRGLSPEGRKVLRAWIARVRASEKRSVRTVPTLTQLSATVRERNARLTAWANANAGSWRRP